MIFIFFSWLPAFVGRKQKKNPKDKSPVNLKCFTIFTITLILVVFVNFVEKDVDFPL